MVDARSYSQVLGVLRDEEGVILYLKDKRNDTLWVEGHLPVEENASVKSLLNPNSKTLRFRMPLTQQEVDARINHRKNV